MKKVIFPLLLLAAHAAFSQQYNPQNAGAAAAYNAPLATNKVPLDARAYYFVSSKNLLRPYKSTAEVVARFNDTTTRRGHFSIVINNGGILNADSSITGGTNEEWWFKDGLADVNLVQKTNGSPIGAMVFADDVFSGNAVPASKGDSILYNIISNQTGEVVTYRKITKFADGTVMSPGTEIQGSVAANTFVQEVDGILVRKYNGNYYMLSKEHLTVKDFGAKGDGISNDYAALQNAINTASAWGISLYIPAGKYLFDSTLNLPRTRMATSILENAGDRTQYVLKLLGDGKNTTELHYIGSDSICVQALAGSGGQVSGGGIYDVTISGNINSTIALYIAGRVGFSTFNCGFWNHKIAVKLEDRKQTDEYTEAVIMHDAVFSGCVTFLEYVGSQDPNDHSNGINSFHGSGLIGANGQITDGSTSAIKILGAAHPYNAPMSMHVWMDNSRDGLPKTIILNQVPGNDKTFYGNLNYEASYASGIDYNNPANQFTLAVNNSAVKGQVYYAGTVNGGENGGISTVHSGAMILSNAVQGIGYGAVDSTNDFKFNVSSLKVNNLSGYSSNLVSALPDGTLTTNGFTNNNVSIGGNNYYNPDFRTIPGNNPSSNNLAIGSGVFNGSSYSYKNIAIGNENFYSSYLDTNCVGIGDKAMWQTESFKKSFALGYNAGSYSYGYNVTNAGAIGANTFLMAKSNSLNLYNCMFITDATQTGSPGSGLNYPTPIGLVGIGTVAPQAVLDVTSTTSGFLPPRMTTAQRTALTPVEGMLVYDTTLHKLYCYDGTTWQAAW